MEFEKSMEAEHCSMGGYKERFEERDTWPAKEWAITVHGDYTDAAYMGRSRKLLKIEELLNLDVVKQAGLTRYEVISIVLYTGPMVSQSQFCRRRAALFS